MTSRPLESVICVEEIKASFAVLDAFVTVTASHRGAALDRLLDELHAVLLAAALRILVALGWETRIEVTFAVQGERGSIDILGWKAADQALLVVEIKSELPGVDPLLRPLDTKVRLAPAIARQRFGWDAATVSRLVVLPEDSTGRRLIARHSAVFDQALPERSREVRSWIRAPRGTLAGLWFLSLGRSGNIARNRSAIRRVQRPRSRTNHARDAIDSPDARLIDPHNVLGEHK